MNPRYQQETFASKSRSKQSGAVYCDRHKTYHGKNEHACPNRTKIPKSLSNTGVNGTSLSSASSGARGRSISSGTQDGSITGFQYAVDKGPETDYVDGSWTSESSLSTPMLVEGGRSSFLGTRRNAEIAHNTMYQPARIQRSNDSPVTIVSTREEPVYPPSQKSSTVKQSKRSRGRYFYEKGKHRRDNGRLVHSQEVRSARRDQKDVKRKRLLFPWIMDHLVVLRFKV
ncbi:hypothetical protein BDV25DRAFT_136133 [Aspergillus avenaceus]|uniref:Uncharacterized protein n=1 Tax=Aspergillus avenaceus TaxID=36643 RepID=A0A5N6U6E6_ASPAV|nr:hypothetical protein BDV25DRAFT_136133 [Aspergillus avenaceus]